MEAIRVIMLGKFDLLANGRSVMNGFANSPKSVLLLQYLLLNRGKSAAVSDLINTFWPDPDKSANPENALKTMISRIRAGLARESAGLSNCIMSVSRSYIWNPDIQCSVDVFELERLCGELLVVSLLTNEARDKFYNVIELYGGDLAAPSLDEDWLVGRSVSLHDLYLKTVALFIELLKKEGDIGTVVDVCRKALDIDILHEALNLELMRALTESGQKNAALAHYRHITAAYIKYLGAEPPEEIVGLYLSLIESETALESNIVNIRRYIMFSDSMSNGAYVCSYTIFSDIYQFYMRNLERWRDRLFLTLLIVAYTLENNSAPIVTDGVMGNLLEILKACLRKGDAVARYNPFQYAILLPMLNIASSQSIISRVKDMFYQQYPDSRITLSFQYETLDFAQQDYDDSLAQA